MDPRPNTRVEVRQPVIDFLEDRSMHIFKVARCHRPPHQHIELIEFMGWGYNGRQFRVILALHV